MASWTRVLIYLIAGFLATNLFFMMLYHHTAHDAIELIESTLIHGHGPNSILQSQAAGAPQAKEKDKVLEEIVKEATKLSKSLPKDKVPVNIQKQIEKVHADLQTLKFKAYPRPRVALNPKSTFLPDDKFPYDKFKTREIPDVRAELCRYQDFHEDLDPACVILPVRNESMPILVTSIKTILQRTPHHLLQQIVIVDDANTPEYLAQMQKEFKDFPKTTIHTNEKREGLIRARLNGMKSCKAPVTVFLDCHIEVNTGWLEPLLQVIKEDSSAVALPEIDIIKDGAPWTYSRAGDQNVGSFTWNLEFTWIPVNDFEKKMRIKEFDLKLTPTMAGGLFAISTEFFHHIGLYDEEFNIYGAEGLELSFRIWMCHGSMFIVPCSRVGHIFRSWHSYDMPHNVNKNKRRLAEVWMDKYKEHYYDTWPRARKVDMGDITARKQLRRRLMCHNFEWYLKNLVPNKEIPKR